MRLIKRKTNKIYPNTARIYDLRAIEIEDSKKGIHRRTRLTADKTKDKEKIQLRGSWEESIKLMLVKAYDKDKAGFIRGIRNYNVGSRGFNLTPEVAINEMEYAEKFLDTGYYIINKNNSRSLINAVKGLMGMLEIDSKLVTFHLEPSYTDINEFEELVGETVKLSVVDKAKGNPYRVDKIKYKVYKDDDYLEQDIIQAIIGITERAHSEGEGWLADLEKINDLEIGIISLEEIKDKVGSSFIRLDEYGDQVDEIVYNIKYGEECAMYYIDDEGVKLNYLSLLVDTLGVPKKNISVKFKNIGEW